MFLDSTNWVCKMVLGHAAARRPAVWPLIKLYPLSLGPGFVEDPTLFFPVFLSLSLSLSHTHTHTHIHTHTLSLSLRFHHRLPLLCFPNLTFNALPFSLFLCIWLEIRHPAASVVTQQDKCLPSSTGRGQQAFSACNRLYRYRLKKRSLYTSHQLYCSCNNHCNKRAENRALRNDLIMHQRAKFEWKSCVFSG